MCYADDKGYFSNAIFEFEDRDLLNLCGLLESFCQLSDKTWQIAESARHLAG